MKTPKSTHSIPDRTGTHPLVVLQAGCLSMVLATSLVLVMRATVRMEDRIRALESKCLSIRERLYGVEADNARHILKTEGLQYYGSMEPTIENAYRALGVDVPEPGRGRVK